MAQHLRFDKADALGNLPLWSSSHDIRLIRQGQPLTSEAALFLIQELEQHRLPDVT